MTPRPILGGHFHGGLKCLGSQGIRPEFWPLLQCAYGEHLTGPPLPLKVTNPEEKKEEEGEAGEQESSPCRPNAKSEQPRPLSLPGKVVCGGLSVGFVDIPLVLCFLLWFPSLHLPWSLIRASLKGGNGQWIWCQEVLACAASSLAPAFPEQDLGAGLGQV